MILESIIVPLLANIDKFATDLDKAKQKANKTTKDITDDWKKTGDNMMKIGGVMSLGITAPLTALGTNAINAASDLNETTSKVGVVFGKNAEEVLKFGENSAQALGMSQNAALSAAGTYGNLFVSMGMATDQSANMSMGLVSLAGDLASFNNLNPEDVLEKLRAGLTGETEPLKSLGVNLNAATVEAKAMEMGLIGAGQELTASTKAQATYALILEQTKTAQGDFARTSDGMANQTRIAKAEFENLSAQFGATLLPIVNDLLKNYLMPLLKWFTNLDPATKNTIVVIAGIAAAIGPVITVVGGVISAISTVVGLFGAGGALATAGTFLTGTILPAIGAGIAAIGWPILAVIAVVAALIAIWVIFGDDIKRIAGEVWQSISENFGKAKDWLSNTFLGIFEDINNGIKSVISWIGNFGDSLLDLALPEWLRPGSPPPLYYAVKDIGDAMGEVNQSALPDFESNLNMSGVISTSTPNTSNNSQSNELAEIKAILNELLRVNKDNPSIYAIKTRDAFQGAGLV